MKSKTEKYQGNINQTKSWSFEKTDKIVKKPVVGVTKMKKKRHNQHQEIQQVGEKTLRWTNALKLLNSQNGEKGKSYSYFMSILSVIVEARFQRHMTSGK